MFSIIEEVFMAIKADYHVHSYHSGDSDESMEKIIKQGIELGLTDICFTEHHDIDYHSKDPKDDAIFDLNVDSYLYELLSLKEQYKDQINLHFGVEIGMQPHLRRELALFSKGHEFDFIIASSHMLNHKDPYFRELFSELSDEEMYRMYFKELYEDLKVFSNFDVLGHLDYIVRYGNTKDADYSYDKYKDVIDPILEKLIDMEKGLEINTNGLRCGMKSPNPNIDILKKYHSLGGEIITVGSDAHEAKYLSYEFDTASDILKECGFKYYCTFNQRYAEYHKL